jgi:oligopeptide transport system substrate-binding protein
LDEATAWSDYQAGLLHSVVVPESEWAAAMADPALQQQISYAHRPCTYYYGFNTSKAPFDNVLVRKAFIAAIDRQGLIDAILPSRATPAQTYATPTMVGYVDGVAVGIGIPYNPSQAQSWLAAAGYPGGVGLPPITLMYNTYGKTGLTTWVSL